MCFSWAKNVPLCCCEEKCSGPCVAVQFDLIHPKTAKSLWGNCSDSQINLVGGGPPTPDTISPSSGLELDSLQCKDCLHPHNYNTNHFNGYNSHLNRGYLRLKDVVIKKTSVNWSYMFVYRHHSLMLQVCTQHSSVGAPHCKYQNLSNCFIFCKKQCLNRLNMSHICLKFQKTLYSSSVFKWE